MSELGKDARALIERARDADDPSPADRHRVRRRLAAAAAVGVAATATQAVKAAGAMTAGASASSAAVGTITTAKVAMVLLSGLAAGAVAAGGAAMWSSSSSAKEPAALTAPARQSGLEKAPVIPEAIVPAQAEEPTVQEAPAPPAQPNPKAARNDGPTLAQETALLESARAALARGDALAALNLTSEHGRKFPQGALTQEATVTRILALCDAGQIAAARQAATRFLRTSPHSPLRTRILSSCAAPDPALSETEIP